MTITVRIKEEEKLTFSSLEEVFSFERYDEITDMRLLELELIKIPENLPLTLIKFNCENNKIEKIENLPVSLVEFYCGNNRIKKIENLPLFLVKFNCWNNQITKIENLPSTLVEFVCNSNKIEKIENLSPFLIEFSCGNNRIKKIENLSSFLIGFDCWNNQIKKIENLPPFLIGFNCCNNQIKKIGILPSSIEHFNGEKYISPSIIDSLIGEEITKEEFIFLYKGGINYFPLFQLGEEDETQETLNCKICRIHPTEENPTIYTCIHKDHCFCVDCFTNWYFYKEHKCLVCFKPFSL